MAEALSAVHLFAVLNGAGFMTPHSQWPLGCCHASNSQLRDLQMGGLAHLFGPSTLDWTWLLLFCTPPKHLLSSGDLGFGMGQCRLCCRHAHLASVSEHPDQLSDPEGPKKCLLISWQLAALTLMNSRGWPGCSGKPGLCLEHLRSQMLSMCKPSSSLHHWRLTALKLSLLFRNHQFSWKK